MIPFSGNLSYFLIMFPFNTYQPLLYCMFDCFLVFFFFFKLASVKSVGSRGHINGYRVWACPAVCKNLVPRPGKERVPPGLGVQSINHWTNREEPVLFDLLTEVLSPKQNECFKSTRISIVYFIVIATVIQSRYKHTFVE